MKRKTIQTIIFLFISTSHAYSQLTDSPKIKKDTFNTYEELRIKQKLSEIDTLTYLDSTFNFQVKIPGWFHLKETGSRNLLGGTLPAINGIENAILIKSFYKFEFKSFDEFKYIYLTGNIFGQPTKYSNEIIWYGQNKLIEVDNGVKQKVFTFWRNKFYTNEFILLETKSAYLWIQFTSTSDTYEINVLKFDEFMKGFETTNF